MATVLFADEERLRIAPFVETLEDCGHKVIMATDASKAVTVAREKADEIDVIVMDLMMPGGQDAPEDLDPRRSGLWAVEEMRKDHRLKTTPVIVLSAVSKGRVADRKSDLGWIEYLEKPVDLDVFVDVVNRSARKRGG